MLDNEYTPSKKAPINLDMTPFTTVEQVSTGLKVSSLFYGIAALACVVILCFRTKVIFIYQYTMLFEAMTAILLFLAIKCGIKYLRTSGHMSTTKTLAARIIKAVELANGTEITVEYAPEKETKTTIFTEKFTISFLDQLKLTKLNALPLCIQGKGEKPGSIWLDLTFENGILSTTRLKSISNNHDAADI